MLGLNFRDKILKNEVRTIVVGTLRNITTNETGLEILQG